MKRVVIFSLMFLSINLDAGTARFKVVVLDRETSRPIKNAKVGAWFENRAKGWMRSGETNMDFEYTNSKGECFLSGSSDNGKVAAAVFLADNYYAIESIPNCIPEGTIKWQYKSKSTILGRWLPDDMVVTTKIDRIINPIPLFVKKVVIPQQYQANVFSQERPLAEYDLVKGDWLPPYGYGTTADLSLQYEKELIGVESYKVPGGIETNTFYRYGVNISFSQNNGLIDEMLGSEHLLRLREAPKSGYKREWFSWKGRLSRTENETNIDKRRCYYFRIRTELDKSGNITRALYGKIYGDFQLIGDGKKINDIKFLYYLNPMPNDHNLEWDMKNNLCPTQERIRNPQP